MTGIGPERPSDRDLQFCPRCAGRLERRPAGDAGIAHPVCAACGLILWQNPKPCVDALIVRHATGATEVLLGRQSGGGQVGLWDFPGNFLNAGDRIDEALRRECRREMDVEIAVDDIVGAFDGTFNEIPIVTLVYACRLVSGSPRPADLIDEVRWFDVASPPPLASGTTESALALFRARAAAPATATRGQVPR